MPNAPATSRPDVEGIKAETFRKQQRWDFHPTLNTIAELIEYIEALEVVVKAARKQDSPSIKVQVALAALGNGDG